MRTAYLAALLVLASSCAYRPEVAVLAGAKRVDGHRSTGAALVVSQQLGEHWTCSYVHLSDPTAGWPVNDEYDVSDDFVGCGARFGGGRR